MEFPLTEERINQIIFAMEDQRHRFLVHRRTGELVREDELAARPGLKPSDSGASQAAEKTESEEQETAVLDGKRDDPYVPIPSWEPMDGFHLMERFVLKLRNPIFTEMLREALSSGKGVFRKFKDIVKKNREMEHLWFTFKEREMRQAVQEWYEGERELAGLQRLAGEPEPPEELLVGDFAVVWGESRHLEPVLKLDQKAFLESQGSDRLYRTRREELPALLDPGSLLLVVETPQAEFGGFVWAVEEVDPEAEKVVLRLVQLAVRKHFRGLGLASLLVKRLVQEARDRGYERVIAPLSGPALSVSPLFEGLGFHQRAVELEIDPAWPE